MENSSFRKKITIFICLMICLVWGAHLSFAAFKEDPIKATQTDPVPVTEELLTREGQPGPASPTFRMEDTSKFLVKKPYEKVETEEGLYSSEDQSSPWWDDWFSWEKEGSKDLSSEGGDTK